MSEIERWYAGRGHAAFSCCQNGEGENCWGLGRNDRVVEGKCGDRDVGRSRGFTSDYAMK